MFQFNATSQPYHQCQTINTSAVCMCMCKVSNIPHRPHSNASTAASTLPRTATPQHTRGVHVCLHSHPSCLAFVCVCVCECLHLRDMHTCVRVCMYVRVRVYLCMYVYVCISVCLCMCTPELTATLVTFLLLQIMATSMGYT